MKFAAIVLGLALVTAACASGESARDRSVRTPGAHVRFTVDDAQVEPAIYSLVIFEDGSGRYTAQYTPSPQTDVVGQRVSEAIRIDGPLLERIFSEARAHHYFAFACEDKQHRVAFTGNKTLAYTGPDGAGSCTFNYSRDQWLDKMSAALIGVSTTLDFGVRLKLEHRYDPLALDGELASLEEAVKQGRALEAENIAPELRSIAEDASVMNRARAKARKLLSEASATH